MGREFKFADQDSSRSDASSEVVHWEGQQHLESRHPARETAGIFDYQRNDDEVGPGKIRCPEKRAWLSAPGLGLGPSRPPGPHP